MRARKSLGQNFLTSQSVARDIVAAARLVSTDTVLEIGPGKGFLTEHLLRAAGNIIAVETDARMVEYLNDKFAEEIKSGKLKLIHKDILEFDPADYGLRATDYKLVANIPYYITGEILRKFLSGATQPKHMILMVQKEVAERIVARDKKESILSMSVKAYGTPRYMQKVSARYFSPKPNVDSAVFSIENISKDNFKDKTDEKKYFAVMKAGFAHKRKMLSGNLRHLFAPERVVKAFAQCGVAPAARAENLSVKEWLCLCGELS